MHQACSEQGPRCHFVVTGKNGGGWVVRLQQCLCALHAGIKRVLTFQDQIFVDRYTGSFQCAAIAGQAAVGGDVLLATAQKADAPVTEL